MTTPDFPDWTQSVGAFDRLTALGTKDVVSGGATLTVGTSRVQAVLVNINLPASGFGFRYVLTAQWTDGTSIVDQDVISFHTNNTYADGTRTLAWTLPVKGESVTFTVVGQDTAAVSLTVQGSTRPEPAPFISSIYGGNRGLLVNQGATAVAAGANLATFYTPPVSKAISLVFVTGIASSSCTANAVCQDGGVATARARISLLGNTFNVTDEDVLIPGLALEWILHNGSAASANLGLVAWDVS